MYRVVGKSTIQISQGDYAVIPLKFKGVDEGEEVVFSIAGKDCDGEPLFEQHTEVKDGTATIMLRRADTKKLTPGAYTWDVYLPNFWEADEGLTPITPKVLQILEVSHDVRDRH